MKRIALFFMAAISLIACQQEIIPEIKVSSTETTISVEGSEDKSFKIAFNANVDWTAALKTTVDWCTITPTSGVAGDAVVTVIATPNETKDVRTVTLVLTAGTAVKEVEITQAQTNAIALVKESDVVGPAAADYALKVMTNVPYTVTTEADWITVASTKAYAEETTTLKVAAFETLDASRSAEITVAAQGLDPMVFTLTQEGPKSEVWTIDLSTVMNYVAKCTTFDATPDIPNNVSIALFDGNLLVCAGDGSSPVILDKATGEKKGTFTGWDPYTYYIKNDDAGNLILGNRIWGWNYFCLRYVEPGTTTPIPVTDYWNAYIGAGFSVRGNIKSDAVIAAPKENGTYNSNSIFTMSIKGGEVTYNESLPITGFQGLASWGDGWGGMWQNAPNNFPGFALLGPTLQNGALFSVYGENMLYHVNTGTNPATATLLSDQGVLDSNTAANAMDARLIGDATYVAITGGNFYASAPLIQVVNTTTKQVYNLQTVGKAEKMETNSSAAVVMEPAEGGINIYYVNNSTKAIGKHFLAL